jgi:hypothetical protein
VPLETVAVAGWLLPLASTDAGLDALCCKAFSSPRGNGFLAGRQCFAAFRLFRGGLNTGAKFVQRKYRILDVFTERPLAGNALAVVLDGEGLEDGAMQAIAREFNLSETVFVLPPEKPAHAARLRIFTPGAELPFAGHPTVGSGNLPGP